MDSPPARLLTAVGLADRRVVTSSAGFMAGRAVASGAEACTDSCDLGVPPLRLWVAEAAEAVSVASSEARDKSSLRPDPGPPSLRLLGRVNTWPDMAELIGADGEDLALPADVGAPVSVTARRGGALPRAPSSRDDAIEGTAHAALAEIAGTDPTPPLSLCCGWAERDDAEYDAAAAAAAV